jgi:Zn-dependent metalloprotease
MLLTLQGLPPQKIQEKNLISSNQLDLITTSSPEKGWYYFDKNKKINPKDLFNNYHNSFGLSQQDEMRLHKERKSLNEGEVFYRFQQFHSGIKVVGAEYILQSKNDTLELAHGKIIENLNINVKPNITEEKALSIALNEINAKVYAWENSDWEASIKTEYNSDTATWFPKGILQIVAKPGFNDFIKAKFCLIYKFTIQSVLPDDNIYVEIDANTGEVIRCSSNFMNSVGTVGTVYNGTKSLVTYYRGFPYYDFVLEDHSRSSEIDTRNYARETTACTAINFWQCSKTDDHDDYFNLGNYQNAASAHWAAQKAYDVFKNQFGRLYGIREVPGYEIRIWNNYSPSLIAGDEGSTTGFAPGGGGDYIRIGKLFGQTSGYEGSLDVIGHEFTHGVSTFSAGLDASAYSYASGALSESFSDIFGEVIEYYTNSSCDYIAGSNLMSEFKRQFNLPNQFPPHSFYLDYYNTGCQEAVSFTLSDDGVYPLTFSEIRPGFNEHTAHINCSVQNRWFYLLANGDVSLGVQGIGITKAAIITYRNIVDHISLGSNYTDSRLGSIESARSIYGECSLEYQQVMNAWAAVGVGSPAPNPCIPATPLSVSINSPYNIICDYINIWSSSVSGGTGSYSYNWYVNGMLESTSSSLALYLASWQENQSFTIKLVVTSGTQTVTVYDYFYLVCSGMYSSQSTTFDISLYPNPVTEQLNIEIIPISSDVIILDQYNFYISDMQGVIYSHGTLSGGSKEINLSRLKSGSYYLIVNDKKTNVTKIFLKK